MGIETKPAKETDLPIDEISFKIKVSGLIENWNTIRKNKDIRIEYIILKMRSLNDVL